MAKLHKKTVLAIANRLSEPYEGFFEPLTRAEVKACVKALREHSGVAAPSDRLHAQWALHIAKCIRLMAEE